MKKYMADFETSTWLEDETYVWAWATCSIDENFEIEYGNTIESFMEWCSRHRNSEVYFHNEKFDRRIYFALFTKKWIYSCGR